jgi:PTH1 family peptidyl-tRNA hydrolase
LRRLEPSQNFSPSFKGLASKTSFAGHGLLLLKPQTFMNLSGESVQPAMAFHKIHPDQVIVVHDEMDLPFGEIRLKKSGGHGGHNGLRDIMKHIGPDFLRVRVGIGKPAIKGAEAGYVLAPYRKDEQPALQDQIARAQSAALIIIEKGLEAAQMQFHQKTPLAK